MGKRAAYILLVFSLLLVQFSGLHLHLCTGEEKGLNHPSAHYADGGLLFGEHHPEDDSDDLEASFPGSTFSSSTQAQNQPDFNFDFTHSHVILLRRKHSPRRTLASREPTLRVRSVVG